jgi:hypothetical protein
VSENHGATASPLPSGRTAFHDGPSAAGPRMDALTARSWVREM